MQAYQRDFIRFAIERGVLRFGEFTLKSGRTSPYFFNAGLFDSGLALARLGRFYAEAVIDSGIDFDVLFGPAYKGIPLAATTAVALAEQHQRDLPWCFNRKEAKDHGEGGTLVGAPLSGRVLIIDDAWGWCSRGFPSAPRRRRAERWSFTATSTTRAWWCSTARVCRRSTSARATRSSTTRAG